MTSFVIRCANRHNNFLFARWRLQTKTVRQWTIRSKISLSILIWLCLIFGTQFAIAAADGPAVIRAEAYAAEPLGVGKVTFRLGQTGKMIQYTGALKITDVERRILYPAFSGARVQKLLGNSPAVGGVQTVWFLFRGDGPLTITLHGDAPTSFILNMTRRRINPRRLVFQQWWRQYNASARAQSASGDYPPLVESYLTSMLSRRLNLSPPLLERLSERDENSLQQTFDLLFDVQSIRANSIRQLMTEPPRAGLATLVLPPANVWPSTPLQPLAVEVPMEPIARHVPEECFYIRFGNWQNQLWLKQLMEEYGGDLGRMIQLRGYKSSDSTKLLDQLAMESSQLDDMFGGNLITDVAVIGTDLYIDDGPSGGVMLLGKNSALNANISGRRKRFARDHRDNGVTLRDVQIAGHTVSLLSSPDNKVLSYYAVDDHCHLLSTSRRIVERFFEAGQDHRSLAVNVDFQRARQVMPIDRDDTVFVYLSRQFFHNLLCPSYQIELARRNASIANIQLLNLAQMAAESEGYASDSIDQMISLGLLPGNFNQMPDGSQTFYSDDAWFDSVRGRRGYFRPIYDVAIDRITPAESAWLERRLSFYADKLKQVDPIVIGLKRFELKEKMERVVFDARISPFGSSSFGWLSKILGPPLTSQVTTGQDDLISFQASLAGLPMMGSSGPHQVFAAVQGDVPPKTDLRPTNFMEVYQLLRTTPGYLGAWPKPGYLDVLPALGGQPDAEGFTYSRILDLWRLQHGDFSVVSFDRERLQQIRHQLHVVPAEHPAQVRLRVGDITNSNLKDWANVIVYQRAWETSVANVRLINAMIQQFRLPPDTALARAEDLLGAQLVCSLGGEYALTETGATRMTWQSNQWPSFDQPVMPEDYSAPITQWFRGASLDVYQMQTQFVAHGTLDIQRKSNGGSFSILPSFNLFKGFSKVEELPDALEQGGKLPDPPADPPSPPDKNQSRDRR